MAPASRSTARPSGGPMSATELAFGDPVREPTAVSRRSAFGHRILLLLIGAVTGVLVATAVAGVWPWTILTYEPDLRVNVGRPNPADALGPCPQRSTDVRDHRDDTAGSIWYRECGDYLEIWVTDHMKDGRCVWAIVHWSNGVVDTSERACPAGKMEFSKIAKYAPDFWMELVAVNTD
ncbi:hypothetical protein [Amycolatopsis regifaucium]|uniref:hypothetical protein n=1 Tax=Amycolatopsis regifaucium TaxID=546365 RepID=UPI001FC97F09|nr:hypothetical protein [Amycolatopsis regifaucium]